MLGVRLQLLLAAIAFNGNSQTISPPDSFTLSGKIIDAITSAPLTQASAILVACAGQKEDPRNRIVDAEGQFVFEGVAPGCYRVSAGGRGYALQEYGSRGPRSFGKRLALSENTSITLKLMPGGSITGVVTDEKRVPLSNFFVDLLRPERFLDSQSIVNRGSRLTSASGEFQFNGLEPGTYYVRIRRALKRDAGCVPAQSLATTTYYPSGATQESAVPDRKSVV